MQLDVKSMLVDCFYVRPTYMTKARLCASARQLKMISSISKEFMSICSEKLGNLKKIDALITKYPKYSFDYECACNRWEQHKGDPDMFSLVEPKGSPELLDALFSGWNLLFTKSTFNTYNCEIEEDIKEIVKLNPQSLTCDYGEKRCESHLTPLYVACVNESIPLHIVDFLLTQGADPKASLEFNGQSTHIFKVINDFATTHKDNPRYSSLLELFKRHDVVDS